MTKPPRLKVQRAADLEPNIVEQLLAECPVWLNARSMPLYRQWIWKAVRAGQQSVVRKERPRAKK